MIIAEKMNLILEEKFNLFIEERIANCYISKEGDLINVYSATQLINKELLNKDIDYQDKSIDELRLELRSKNPQHPMTFQDRRYLEELWILEDCLLELAFYLHDYDYDKMNMFLQNEFKDYRQYSELLRKHKFDF